MDDFNPRRWRLREVASIVDDGLLGGQVVADFLRDEPRDENHRPGHRRYHLTAYHRDGKVTGSFFSVIKIPLHAGKRQRRRLSLRLRHL